MYNENKKRLAQCLGNFDHTSRWLAAACNEHIAKIAALPRVDKKSVFLRSLLALIMCWKAATSAICHHVKCNGGQCGQEKIIELFENYDNRTKTKKF